MVAPAGPTATERAAAREAAARAAAARAAAEARRAQQAKLRTQRQRAARLAAAKKAQQQRDEQRESAANAAAPAPQNTEVGPPESGAASATPILLAGLVAALILLGVSLTPASAVPWPRAAFALARNREQVALLGGTAFFTIAFCFLVLRL